MHAYSWLLLCGTAASLAVAVLITIPAAIALIARAAGELAGGSAPGAADGAAALIVVTGFQALWLRTWWRRHGRRAGAWLRGNQRQRAPGGR